MKVRDRRGLRLVPATTHEGLSPEAKELQELLELEGVSLRQFAWCMEVLKDLSTKEVTERDVRRWLQEVGAHAS